MNLIKKIIPDSIKTAIKRVFDGVPTSGWFGDFSTWEEARKKCTGYDQMSIVNKVRASVLKVKKGEAVYERDSVLFHKLYLYQPIIDALLNSVEGQRLHVLDFGGSLGSSYFQHRHLFGHLSQFKWTVVEQAHYVEIGKKDIADKELDFHFTIEEALKHQSNQVLLLSSVLQYIPEPYKFVEKLMSYGFKYIIIDRTSFIERKKDRITTQLVPEEIYKASYPCRFFNESKLLAFFLKKYDLKNEFEDDINRPTLLGKDKVYWKGFYLQLK